MDGNPEGTLSRTKSYIRIGGTSRADSTLIRRNISRSDSDLQFTVIHLNFPLSSTLKKF
jgi:hypothetical protein